MGPWLINKKQWWLQPRGQNAIAAQPGDRHQSQLWPKGPVTGQQQHNTGGDQLKLSQDPGTWAQVCGSIPGQWQLRPATWDLDHEFYESGATPRNYGSEFQLGNQEVGLRAVVTWL